MTEANGNNLEKSKPWPRYARPGRRRRKRESLWWVQGRWAHLSSSAPLAGKLYLQDVAMGEFKIPQLILGKGLARRGFWLSANKLLWLWHMTSTTYFKFTALLCSADFQFNNTELLRRVQWYKNFSERIIWNRSTDICLTMQNWYLSWSSVLCVHSFVSFVVTIQFS